MAVRRFDANQSARVTCAIGTLAGMNHGAFSLVALVRKEADGDFRAVMAAHTDANSTRRGLFTGTVDLPPPTPDRIIAHLGGFNRGGPLGFVQADGWAVIAATKDAGDVPVQLHLGLLDGAVWDHDQATELGFDDTVGTQILTAVTLGAWPGVIGWHGLVAVAAAWNGHALTPAELEEGFLNAASAWLAAEPDALWLLNQDSIATPVEDATGNGADQTSIVATSVVTDNDPPGFNFTIGSATVQLTPAVLDLAPVALSPSALATSPGVLVASTSRPTLLAARSRPLLVATNRVGIPAAPALLNALSNPSLFGWPDDTNTGVPAGTVLTPSGALTVVADGTVVEDLDIDGDANGFGILVQADDVTIRRCRIHTIPQSGGGCIKKGDLFTGLLVEDCELFYSAVGSGDAAVGDMRYTMRRCHIHHVAEGPRLGQDTTMEHCYIHTLLVDDPEAHADGAQSTGGSNIRLARNTIVASQQGADFANAALIIGSEFAEANGIEVVENLLDGGGFTFFLGPSAEFEMSNVTVTGNRFGRAADFGPTSVGAGIVDLLWSGNVFDDSNDEVPAA